MKKNPIYLWILLVLSALSSLLGLFGVLTPVQSADSVAISAMGRSDAEATYLKELVTYTVRTSEHGHSLFNVLLVLVSAVLVVLGIVFLVKRKIQLANYTYLAYALLAIIGTLYSFIGAQDAAVVFTDELYRTSTVVGVRIFSVISVVVNLLFIALVLYKNWRQQKELAEEVEAEEVA
ncbi:hypothetical protein SORDD17_00308 [Streptococcus oralis]|uniref:Uncharacterized protein n=1 Tax=Streptococcus oralis TaxID=1303 RepID=A0A139RP43_STROR|nr:hypothetical protein [Streptococcus oralis]KXU16478.1 hypothetical protein SORDD17_00308 [Streptococcus oralis]